MEYKSSSFLVPGIILFVFTGLFFVSFVRSHQAKGTFWADETGAVLSSITKNRSLKSIFYDAAFTSQPPLDHILREKLYVPLGESLGISTRYPEFFHRLPALLWWLLPIGYFAVNLKDFSSKHKTVIILALLFLVSSQFLRHYLAEARHYSAIPAVFTTMIIIFLGDRIKLSQVKYQFLAVSSLFPFLHAISFPFYLIFMAFFFYQIRRELDRRLLIGYGLYIGLVLMMYYEIKRFSSPWQHPSPKNLLGLNVVKDHIKWTLDWIFYGGVLHPLYKYIPEAVKNNLLSIFAVVSGYLSFKLVVNLPNLFLVSIVFVWPLSILSTLYFSGSSGGERYSIVVMPITLFYVSWLIVNLIWKTLSTTRSRMIASVILVGLALAVLLVDVLPVDVLALDTPDNQFVKQNDSILKNKDAYLILDNGVYSAAFFPLAAIHRIPIKINYLQCRDGQFQTSGKNTLNDWLDDHISADVYLYSLYSSFMDPEKIVWKKDDFVLYRLTSIPEAELCQNPDSIGECYLKCIRGGILSPDGRSIKGVAPNLGVYRP